MPRAKTPPPLVEDSGAGGGSLGGERPQNRPTHGPAQLPITIGTVTKNDLDEVRVSLEAFKGRNLVDVRTFSNFTAANVKMPTRHGVSLNVRQLPELAKLLAEAERKARELGLLDG